MLTNIKKAPEHSDSGAFVGHIIFFCFRFTPHTPPIMPESRRIMKLKRVFIVIPPSSINSEIKNIMRNIIPPQIIPFKSPPLPSFLELK